MRRLDTHCESGFRTAALFAVLSIFASISICSTSLPPASTQTGMTCSSETLRTGSEEFIRRHSFTNPHFKPSTSRLAPRESDVKINVVSSARQVRAVYLVPTDKVVKEHYRTAISNAILHLQSFYQSQMGAAYNFATFSVHEPVVEVYTTSHTANFYTNLTGDPFAFFKAVLSDGFALSGGGFNDPNYRWLYFIDADNACDQIMGGTSGVALLATNDLRGLTREPGLICGATAFPSEPCRWVGGEGHELAHAWDVPHPPGCDQGNCLGGSVAASSMMWFGFTDYPKTYFLEEDKNRLFATGFFTSSTILGPRFDCNATRASTPPLLFGLNGTDETAALDSVLFVRDPFYVINSSNLFTKPNDKNSRIVIFAKNLQLALPDAFNVVRIKIIDGNSQLYEVSAEDVRPVPNVEFTQIVFRLPDTVSIGRCSIAVSVNGLISNQSQIQITK
jgi:hypothetical protein